MATAKKKTTASYQPVFPKEYPKKCHSCKTPHACEKIVVKGRNADACIYVCPNDRAFPQKP